MKKSGLRLLPR